jgi:hypothetical protein
MAFETKINLLAACRSEPLNMKPFIPDDGYVFVFSDVIACEPTIQANLTKDPVLIYQTATGIGKPPFYTDEGLLQIDDVYLALASVSPISKDLMFEAYYNWEWGDGISFAEQWVKDRDVIKEHKKIKPVRKFSKICLLALSYGQKGDAHREDDTEHGLKNNAHKAGYTSLTGKQAWEIYHAYWDMYKEIKAYKDLMEKALKMGKKLYNPFGFPLNPKHPKDIYNTTMQSSADGVLSLAETIMEDRVESRRLDAHFVLCIHDEDAWMVREDQAEELCEMFHEAGDIITRSLGWEFPIRFDPKIARNFYEGK